MGLPVIYKNRAPAPILTYDWVDIADGTGIVRYYAGGTQDSAGIKYRLDRNTFRTSISSRTVTQNCARSAVINTAAFAKYIDLDFDTTVFNHPTAMRGTMLSNIPVMCHSISAGHDGEFYVVVSLIKVDAAAAETVIVSTQSNTLAYVFGATYQDKYMSLLSTVPLTNLKKGEKLRITVELWAKWVTTTDDTAAMVSFSPLNEEVPVIDVAGTVPERLFATAGYTQMQFLIPFKIDL